MDPQRSKAAQRSATPDRMAYRDDLASQLCRLAAMLRNSDVTDDGVSYVYRELNKIKDQVLSVSMGAQDKHGV